MGVKEGNQLNSEQILQAVVAAADDKKAQDLVVLDLRGISLVADYFVICSGESKVQVRAIYRAVEEALKDMELPVKRRSGSEDGGWVLLDYGDVVVHVFHHAEREYYDLERLWGDAKRLTVQEVLKS